jgi:hypothetical protein
MTDPQVKLFSAFWVMIPLRPFSLGVKTLAEFLLRKYVFNRHEPHAALFLSQNITEAVWGTLLTICLVTAVL